MKVAAVAIEKTAYHFDKLFSYSVPGNMAETLQPGCRVTVPFGAGNKKRQGMVFALDAETNLEKLKPLSEQIDEKPLLTAEMLMLAQWLKENYYCTLFEAVRLMLPTGININIVRAYRLKKETEDKLSDMEETVYKILKDCEAAVSHDRLAEVVGDGCDKAIESLLKKGIAERTDEAVRRVGDATVKMVRLTELAEDAKLTAKQKVVVELLQNAGGASVKEVCYFTGVTAAVVDRLVKNGIAEYYENEVYRNPYEDVQEAENEPPIELSEEQTKAYDTLLAQYSSEKPSTTLLYGVTGSGKTSVFMKLIDSVLGSGKGIIVMVPEIALTPQTLGKFHRHYGKKCAVFHSGLSLGQRMDEWKRVKNGDAQIVIGTRSAVFAPFRELGLIIIDEEQEYTYKSEQSPRYHARDVARFRCGYHKSLLVLSSATPSIESYYNAAVTGAYTLAPLRSRYGSAVLPSVEVVDISGNRTSEGIISNELYEALSLNLQEGKQSILLHNRRGYNTFVSCRSCGHVLMCENCSVSMTYHSDNGRLMCHYCGMSVPFTSKCPDCGADQLRYAGLGTQRVIEEVQQLFPTARILRMDADTTMTRFSHEEKLGSFGNHEYDIMIGTQMVAKGLDFERVTLVGVLMADLDLYSDDFRSMERGFSLLTQVVGRSGRGKNAGRAIIQTLKPDNPVIPLAAKQDYGKFFESEIKIRKAMLYPPYADICMVGFVGISEGSVKASAGRFFEMLRDKATTEYSDVPLRVLGPSVASIGKMNSKFRYKLILKCRNDRRFRRMMSELLVSFGADRENDGVTAWADINPDSIM